MQAISSSSNQLIRRIKRLSSSQRARSNGGETLLEGVHLAQSYLEHIGLPKRIIVTEKAIDVKEVGDILSKCSQSIRADIISSKLFKQISLVDNGIELIFLIDIPQGNTQQRIIENSVILENVQDPGNVGTILRTAAAAGIKRIFCSSGTASVWSPKVLRAGMGAQFALDIQENSSPEELTEKSNIQVLATTPSARQSIYQTDLTKPTAWIIGNEGSGVSSEILNSRVNKVFIPQSESVESLNAAAAAAVCLFEQRRQQISLTD